MQLLAKFSKMTFPAFLAVSAIFLGCILSMPVVPQEVSSIPYKSQQVSESDGVPILLKHLPDWPTVRGNATITNNIDDLRTALGAKPVLDLIDFSAGTEAATAPYPAGKLLIIEYTSPQASVEADGKFTSVIAESNDSTTTYRRIGNYNVFVFDVANKDAAAALMDQVKYEKMVQWLGDNPYNISPERAFVLTTSDIFMSTLLVIIMGIGLSIVSGISAGFIYFQLRERRRSGMSAFSDAGGMTRLNLDGFTPEILPERLLGD